MSSLFGPMIQQGYIVPDMDGALRHWLDRGVGPFYLIAPFELDALHYGTPTTCRMTAAFACSGDQQIELIQPLSGSGPNIYDDYLRKYPEGGLQHLASWCDDIDGKLTQLTAAGVDYVLAQRYPASHAYLDLRGTPGVMIQLMPMLQRYLDLYDACRTAAAAWDGKSDPVRRLPEAVRAGDWAHPT